MHLYKIIGAGNVCKAMCGVAAGACNSAINLYWAEGSDISDINAKFGAQVRQICILVFLAHRYWCLSKYLSPCLTESTRSLEALG